MSGVTLAAHALGQRTGIPNSVGGIADSINRCAVNIWGFPPARPLTPSENSDERERGRVSAGDPE